jgi:hypothetical protein
MNSTHRDTPRADAFAFGCIETTIDDVFQFDEWCQLVKNEGFKVKRSYNIEEDPTPQHWLFLNRNDEIGRNLAQALPDCLSRAESTVSLGSDEVNPLTSNVSVQVVCDGFNNYARQDIVPYQQEWLGPYVENLPAVSKQEDLDHDERKFAEVAETLIKDIGATAQSKREFFDANKSTLKSLGEYFDKKANNQRCPLLPVTVYGVLQNIAKLRTES